MGCGTGSDDDNFVHFGDAERYGRVRGEGTEMECRSIDEEQGSFGSAEHFNGRNSGLSILVGLVGIESLESLS